MLFCFLSKKLFFMYLKFFKRIFDFLFALILGVILIPFLFAIAIYLRLTTGTSAIFKQTRVGKGEKLFHIYKLKTMTDARDKDGNLLPDTDRTTKFGSFLRKTSIDELPQLINILKGDMSFIGPRPFLSNFLPYYTDEERRRHLVRPGISGLAQVNGRNGLSYEDRFKYDLKYVDTLSFMLDLKIVFKTIVVIFSARNTSYIVQNEFDVQRKKNLDK